LTTAPERNRDRSPSRAISPIARSQRACAGPFGALGFQRLDAAQRLDEDGLPLSRMPERFLDDA
jgi:hypothetical protein